MKISRESRRQARGLFRLACADGVFSPERAREIADALIADRPRGVLGTLKEFARLVRLELDKTHATITSATALDPDGRSLVENALLSRFDGTLETEFREDPALIGGLRIQVGSDVWDGSIRARLEAFQAQF